MQKELWALRLGADRLEGHSTGAWSSEQSRPNAPLVALASVSRTFWCREIRLIQCIE